jgi:diguanylate cyclase (GGDEF)-like protein
MATLNFIDSFFYALEPRGVLSVGGAIALSIGFLLAFQAYKSRTDRLVFTLAAVCSMLAAGSFFLSAPLYFQVLPVFRIFISVMMGTALMFCGMSCFVLLFQPKFSPLLRIFLGVICLVGYVKWPAGEQLSHWFFFCQLLITLVTAYMLATSKETLAPQMRWFAIALCVIAAIGAGPRLWWIATTLLDPRLMKPQTASTQFRFAALIWVLLPIVFYMTVVGVTQARVIKKLRNTSDFDLLTGAHSRRYLMETGQNALDDRRRSALGVTVLLIDIDHFKRVNDTWGHAVRDEVLKHCVRNFQEVLRKTDSIVSRYGGEEFCVLLPALSTTTATQMAERIRRRIANTPYRQGSVSIPVTISIGISYNIAGTQLPHLIEAADKNLYRAKRGGRNRVKHNLDGVILV